MAGTIGMFAEMDRMEAVNMMKGIELDGKRTGTQSQSNWLSIKVMYNSFNFIFFI